MDIRRSAVGPAFITEKYTAPTVAAGGVGRDQGSPTSRLPALYSAACAGVSSKKIKASSTAPHRNPFQWHTQQVYPRMGRNYPGKSVAVTSTAAAANRQ